ncbi:class I adenylate-forming enzyme family protein [Pseudonocardia sp. KRD291]|uniref:class I adenylate-forming enzyme family protein n=1 Tax=Pseudonocardia sp. KRD291 TaxID=2792007 RepID=UPI001C49EEBF|nr:class I adenylate-forming enzyme family protein [Pseudonocardia sp. KRD291]MBW0101842.1 acyl--CoA ligase [Pseudonocardia sp. KRD291]
MLRTEYIRPVHEILAGHAAGRPDRTAFVDDVRTITYAELSGTTARLAGHLQEAGVERGDRVLLYLNNRVEVAESYLAVPRSGAVAVCVNPASPVTEVEHVLGDSGARVVITDAEHLDVVRGLASGADLLAVVVVGGVPAEGVEPREIAYADLVAAPAAQGPRDCLGLDDTAWMLYTSGTTGRPKGVYLTQRGCFWVVAACWAPIGIGPDDVLLSPLPLFHSYALVLCVLGVAAVGASERILPRFSVDDVAERLTGGPEGDVTVLPGVPTMFHYLVDRLETLDAPGLRMCISAGAILAAAVNERFEAAFSVPLLDGYGITETSTMVTMNWPTGERVMGSCGLPLPGLTVRLVDPATLRDVLPGEEGEIWVQGPNVTPGYHHLPDATAAAIVDGWYRTGDLARRDGHGYLRISGRTKELIIRGGENIYPAEVEDALLGMDAVADAAVVGVPHEHLGEVPVAFVVPRGPGPLDHDAVLAGARQRLSSFKVPARLVEVGAIPRTGSGKILRFRLRDQVASG